MSGGFMLPVPTQLFNETAQSTTYLAKAGDFVVATGTWALTLPVAAGVQVVVQNAGTGVITLSPASGKLNAPGNWNASTLTLPQQGDFALFVGDGTNANVVAGSPDIIGTAQRDSSTINIVGQPSVTTADENPYPGFQIAVPTGQVKKLHGVTAVSPTASGGATYKLRRYTGGAWADISGFGTTGAPLTAHAGSATGTVTAPGDVILADGDRLAVWVVAAGTGDTSLSVSLLIDTYGA